MKITFASLTVVCLLTLGLLSGCGGNREIKPDERVKPIETSAASQNRQARADEGETDARAITIASKLAEEAYVIGPDDVLDIKFLLIEELSGEYTVSARGELRLPLVGTVAVAGLSAEQIESALETMYARDYLQNPEITVSVIEFHSQQVTLIGEVNQPGVYPLKGKTSLMEAIALAKGTNRIADLTTIIVFREETNGQVFGYTVNLQEVMAGAKPDPDVFGSDRIVVPEDGSASFLRSLSVGLPGFGGYRQY